MLTVAPPIVNDVSYVMPVNHEVLCSIGVVLCSTGVVLCNTS